MKRNSVKTKNKENTRGEETGEGKAKMHKEILKGRDGARVKRKTDSIEDKME